MRGLLAWVLGVLLVARGLASPIPPRPEGDRFVHDLAHLMDPAAEEVAQGLADQAYRSFNAPIVVVTIRSLGDYGSSSIEGLATRWFNEWRIGTLGLEGGSNQGILLLVAVRDRKARIELGATWGRRWDRRCERIMSGDIVPAFKQGDYPGGILAGVQALHEMAQLGPDSHPPGDVLQDIAQVLCVFSWFPQPAALFLIGLGACLLMAGVVAGEEWRGFLLVVGTLLLMVGAFTYVTLMLFGLVFGGSGGGGGGGGFSGGFSGGGGASGSW